MRPGGTGYDRDFVSETRLLRAARFSILLVAPFLLTGFLQVHDDVVVRGSGAARVRRTVVLVDTTKTDELLERLRAKEDPKSRREGKRQLAELRSEICEAVTTGKASWDRCRWEGSTLVVEKRYGQDESPFSSSERGLSSFALHHFLSTPITRPPFPLLGVGPVMQDDDEHRRAIAELRRLGYALDVTIRMPGKIRMLWGKPVEDGGDVVFVDLLDDWPEERQDTFLLSEAGLLHSETFHLVLMIALGTLGLAWLYRVRPR